MVYFLYINLLFVVLDVFAQEESSVESESEWSWVGELDFGHLAFFLLAVFIWKGSWILGFIKKDKNGKSSNGSNGSNGHSNSELVKISGKIDGLTADLVLIKTVNDDIVKGRVAYEASMTQKVQAIQEIVLNELNDMRTDEKETSKAVGNLAVKIGELSGEIKGMRR